MNEKEEILKNLTPEGAQVLFKQLMSKTHLNTIRAYVQVECPVSKCKVFIPCQTNTEEVMNKTKEFYQELVDIAEF